MVGENQKPIAFGPILVTDTGSKLGTLQLRALQLRDILEANGFAKVLEASTYFERHIEN